MDSKLQVSITSSFLLNSIIRLFTLSLRRRLTHLVQNVFYTGFGPGTIWDRGKFAEITVNNSLLVNPWGTTGNPNTPFDQDFYLILNVAVGSLNGYFPDSVGSKPWVDASTYLARGDFWRAADKWLPTWGAGNSRGMTVKSVKMWQEGACS